MSTNIINPKGMPRSGAKVKVSVYAPEIIPLSLCDYPGEPSCVIFFSGCNFDCGYCQNWRLKLHSEAHLIDLEILKECLRKNRLVGACKVTGGEPLLQAGALKELGLFAKSLGLKFGIDTNGSLPGALEDLLPILDLVSLDIKTALRDEEYTRITGSPDSCTKAVNESLKMLLASGAYADLRMVIVPGFNDSESVILSVAESLRKAGYAEKAVQGKASLTFAEFVAENAGAEGLRHLKNPSAEDLRRLARTSRLERVRILHGATGLKEIEQQDKDCK